MQHYFQIYFIFKIYIIILIMYGDSESNRRIKFPDFPGDDILSKNCSVSMCKCADLQKLSDMCYDQYYTYIYKFELTSNNNIKHLPARTFSQCCINHLILDDPEITVDEHVLEGMTACKNFKVQQSNIEIIPDFKFVKQSLITIIIESSRLTSLEGTNLQNLTLVQYLCFHNNFIRHINPDVFQGTENVTELDLSCNLLTAIPPKLLEPMKNLRVFNASHNNLLHADGLFSKLKMFSIDFRFNNITAVGSLLQLDIESVKKLIAMKREKDTIEKYVVKYSSKFRVRSFLTLFFMNSLDWSYNFIQEVPESAFPCYQYIKRGIYIMKIYTLNIMGNKLQNMNIFLSNVEIDNVNATGNEIKYLADGDFNFIHNLAGIMVQKNKISRIDGNVFEPISKSLSYLDLSFNVITSLNGSIRYVSPLRFLNAAHNSIQSLARDEFTGLIDLALLYLEHNRIKTLGQLQELVNLQYLNIKHNNITLIQLDEVPKIVKILQLESNPFICNCELVPFILNITVNDSVSQNTYQSFDALRNFSLNDYITVDVPVCSKSDFHFNLHRFSNCPYECSCGCAKNEDVSYMFLDCSSKNLSVLPEFLGNELIEENATVIPNRIRHVMEQNIYPSLSIQDHVLSINLENNNLETLDSAQLPPKLIQLYLSNNKFRWLPDSILEKQQHLQEVTLSRNPWNCDCNALKFKRWLASKSHVILDINYTRCGLSDNGKSKVDGAVIWTLTDLELCPETKIVTTFSKSIGVLIFLSLCLTAKVLYNKWELNIKVFLYYRGFTFVKEKDLEYDKDFDAFVSFSHKDDEFAIKQIILEIEKKDPSIRLCVHYRHFRPGEFIYDSIILAVQKSKRTIIILTRNFLESEWCLVEFRIAHLQMMEDKMHRVIVIKVGDLPEKFDSTIETHLKVTTYLTWGEKNFWRKLLLILPSGCNVRNSVPKNIRNNEIVLNDVFHED